MAQLFTDDDPTMARVSIPILKYEEADDGAVYVYGKATDATLDRDEQIIDPEFAAKSLAHWFESGANVRVMHSPALYPAGKGVELISGDDGQWLKSRIVEPTAVRLVKEDVLRAYSVGIAAPQIIRDSIAKRGRVVGGETVEVSLVDRPANPSCGVVLAKMAGSDMELVSDFIGSAPEKDVQVKVNPQDLADLLVKLGKTTAAVEKGVAVPAEGEQDHPAADGVVDADIAKSNSKKDCTKCGKKYNADTDMTHCGGCGTKLPAASEKSTESELEKALNPVDGMPYGLRRLHDVTCAAYSWMSVKAVHPVLEKNGIAAALGPSATNLLFRMLEHEIAEDAGTGREARDIGHLAKAYALLAEFLGDETMEPHVFAEARAELHKLFKSMNPMAPDNLTPMGPGKNPNPASFRRPYISGGHANDNAKPGQHPRVPDSSHVPSAGNFQRGLITAGHETDAPMNGGGSGTSPGNRGKIEPTKAPGESKSVEADLTKAGTRERAQAALIAVHDHLADQYPDACVMVPHVADIAVQPLADTSELPNGDTNTPKAAGVQAELLKAMESDLVKAALSDLLEARFATERATYEDQIGKQATKLDELRRQYEELAQAPDPNQAPIRGMAGIEQLLGKRAEEPRDEVKEREDKIRQYARWMESPDPQQREAARSLLLKMAR